MKGFRRACLAAGILWLSGCGFQTPAALDAKTLPLRVLYRNTHCGAPCDQPTGAWIAGPRAYQRLYRGLRQPHVGGAERHPPPVNFSREAVLWICMGRKPTGGYGLAPAENELTVSAGTATLRLDWSTPAPGAVLAQVVTRPCLVLAVPKGEYSRVRVLDRTGRLRLEIPVNQNPAPLRP
jgi:hypothetical protein